MNSRRLLWVLSLLWPWLAVAETRSFEVELLFFKHQLKAESFEEQLDAVELDVQQPQQRFVNWLLPQHDRSIRAFTADLASVTTVPAWVILPASYHVLTPYRLKLKDNKRQLLGHLAWKHEIDPELAELPVYFRWPLTDQPLTSEQKEQFAIQTDIAPEFPLIEGFAQLSLDTYLYLDLNVRFYDNAEGRGVVLAHALDETLKMRSKDIHYADHPRFGVLIKLTPWEGVH